MQLLAFNQNMMSVSAEHYFSTKEYMPKGVHKYKYVDSRSNADYPSLPAFRQWLCDLYSAISQLIANKRLFFATYWHLFKETTLEPKHLSALLLEIRHQQLPIFFGSQLD